MSNTDIPGNNTRMDNRDSEAMDHGGDTQSQAGAVFSLTCIEKCKHGRSSDPVGVEMIRCCICATWYHNECVDLPDEEATGVWPCMSCRLMPSQVRLMQQQISTLMSINESLSQQVNHIATLLEKKCTSDPIDDNSDDDEDYDEDPEPSGSLIIGDSLLRNIKSSCSDLSVECHSGAHFSDIRKCLKTINPKKKRFMDLYVVCGTNDTATKKPGEKIVKDCVSVIDLAKERATNVHLSSIPPRIDNKVDQSKIDEVNESLGTAARNKEVSFIMQEKNFMFRDGTVDESLLNPADGLHLSEKGTSRLLDNLGLKDKATVDFGCYTTKMNPNLSRNSKVSPKSVLQAWEKPLPPPASPPPMRQKIELQHKPSQSKQDDNSQRNIVRFQGAKNPLSNLFPTPINIWGMTFRSVEHAYQYRKAIEMNQHISAEDIRQVHSPYDAMDLAKKVNTDQRWLNMKKSVMYQLLNTKANQCEIFRNKLQSTHGNLIVEDTYHDYWGQGRFEDGLNMMGRLLMTLRDNNNFNCPSPSQHNNTPLSRDHTFNWQHSSRRASNISRGHSHANYGQGQASRRTNQHVKCWYCGEQNHVHHTCRHGKPVQCHKCGNEGHKSKFCRH